MTVDIDEGKTAEERLRRSEAYLAEAQRLTHTGAYGAVAVHADEDFHGDKTFPRRIVYWSDENYRIWGFDPAQGLPSYEATAQRVHPDDRDAVREELLKALHEKRDYALQWRIRAARWNDQISRSDGPSCLLRERRPCRGCRYTC